MKGRNYLITYISALIIGILLLIYHDRAALYNTLVIAIGALIAVPSVVLLLIELCRRKPSAEQRESESAMVRTQAAATNWATIIAGVAGLALGVWMLCSPGFFIKAIIYTLGAILVLSGAVQIVAIYSASKPLKPLMLWFIIPVLTLVAGLIIILLGPDKVSSIAGLVAGISFVVYAANGFACTGREAAMQAEDTKKLTSRKEHAEESKEN